MATMNDELVLETENLSKQFDSLVAVDGISYRSEPTAIDGIIGPNGAGKTTFLNLVSGRLVPTGGRILWDGQDITETPEHRRSTLGIARTFQIIQLFENLSGTENVLLAGLRTEGKHTALLEDRFEIETVNQQIATNLELLDLDSERLEQPVSNLSHLERRKIDLVLALLREPSLLLLDEPFAGLEQESIDEVKRIIRDLVEESPINVILVDHNLPNVIDLVDRLAVFHEGKILAQGDPEDVTADEAVQQSYIGGA